MYKHTNELRKIIEMFFIYYYFYIIKDIECNNILILFLYMFGSILTHLIFHIYFNQQSVNSCFTVIILGYFITCLVFKGFTSLLMYYSHEYDLFSYIKIYASTFKNVSLSYYSQFVFICPAVKNYIELFFLTNTKT